MGAWANIPASSSRGLMADHGRRLFDEPFPGNVWDNAAMESFFFVV